MVEPHFPIGGRTSHWERDRVGKSECGSRGQGKGRNLSLPRRPHLVEPQGRLFLVDGHCWEYTEARSTSEDLDSSLVGRLPAALAPETRLARVPPGLLRALRRGPRR